MIVGFLGPYNITVESSYFMGLANLAVAKVGLGNLGWGLTVAWVGVAILVVTRF